MAALAVLPVEAQDRKTEQAIKHRRAAFTLMATYMNRLIQTVEGGRPFDARALLADARTLELLSRLPWEGFVEGSERGDTRAKDDIWLEEDRFQKMARNLEAATRLAASAAEKGDLQGFKTVFAQTREACNTCHKAFRKD